MTYEESVAALPDLPVEQSPVKSPSLFGRAGQQLANLPSNLMNDLTRLYYNAGFRTSGQAEPVQVPQPFDIAEPKTLGEGVVDLGANIVQSLPWFLSGEGAGEGVAQLAKAGPIMTNVARMAGGFGLQGLTDSPEHAVEEAGLGAAFGGVEKIPGWRYRLLAATLLGGGSALLAKMRGGSNTQAEIAGATNLALPFIGGMKRATARVIPPVEDTSSYARGPAGLLNPKFWGVENYEQPPVAKVPETSESALNNLLQAKWNKRPAFNEGPAFNLEAENQRPANILTASPALTEREAALRAQPQPPQLRLSGESEFDFTQPTPEEIARNGRTQPTAAQPFLPLPPPEGSLIREPSMTDVEARRGAGIQPPPGSIVRNPAITMQELLKGRQIESTDIRPPEPPRPPIAPRPPEPPRAPEPPPVPPPDGSLIRENSVTMDEVMRARAARTPEPGKVVSFPKQPELPASPALQQFHKDFTTNLRDKAEKRLAESPLFAVKGTTLYSTVSGREYKLVTNLGKSNKGIHRILVETPDGGEQFSAKLADFTTTKPVATLQPESAANAKKPSVKLKDVISPENEALAHAAAEKLGMEYQGVGFGGSLMEFKFKNDSKHAAAGANISFRTGGTYKDLKNQAQKKIQAFEEGEKQKVAMLQQKAVGPQPGSAKASQSLSSLENVTPEVETPNLPQGLSVGNNVMGVIPTGIDTERAVLGKILPTVEPGTVRFQDAKGEVYDLHPSKVSKPSDDIEIELEKPVGGSTELDEILQGNTPDEVRLQGGGRQKKSTFGRGGIDKPSEQASVTPEALGAMARYVVAPGIGFAGGYASGDDDSNRLSRGIIGAIITGAAGALGWKAFKALLENPSQAAKAASTRFEAFKAEAKGFAKASVADSQMAARAASDWPGAGAVDRMARWMNKNVVSSMVIAKFLDKAHGNVEYLSQMMGHAINGLRFHKDIESHFDTIGKYFDGDITFATLQSIVPKDIADMAALATETRTKLQQILIAGIGDTKLGNAIKNSVGEYMTTTYRIFHDNKYKPTDAQITAAANSMDAMFGNKSLEVRMVHLKEYLHEIQTNRRLFGSVSGAKGEALGNILSRYEGKLTPEFKQMLGVYDNPLDRMAFTGMKLINGAKSAEFFNEVAAGTKANGLKFAYEEAEWEATMKSLQHDARYGYDPASREAAAGKLAELQSYVSNPSGASNGRLSNKFMDIKTRDQLANYDAASRMFQSPIANAIAQVTNRIKYGKIILSPLQLSRQIIQLPILGMISRTGPASWKEANDVLMTRRFAVNDPRRAEYNRLMQLGVLTGDPVGGMFRQDMRAMMDGSLDSKLSKKLSAGLHQWEELWRTPDLILRASAFMKKEQELLAQGHSSVDATNKALDHMNRYTMNYGAVPAIVAKGRQLPFVNQYLSWTYETLRLTKNLMEDAKGGDVYAMGVLSTIGTLPFLVQAATESQLSPQDRKDWETTKALSPDWNRGNFKWVVGRNPDGTFRYIDYTPIVIHDQFFRMMKGILSKDKDLVTSANPFVGWENTPLLNVAKVMMSDKDNWGHSTETFMEKAQAVRREVLPTLAGTELDRMVRALTPTEDGGLGVTDKRSGTVNSISDILQTYMTSMRPYTVSPNYLKQQAVGEARDRIRSQQLLLRKTLATNASAEVKQSARQQFEHARDEILKSFRDKLGVPDAMVGQ